jgi:flagellar motor switch protein FliM
MMRQKFDQQWLLRKAAATEAEQMRILKLIGQAEVTSEALLSGPRMRLRDLVDLDEGDVLWLDYAASRPLDLLLGGRRKYRGEMVAAGPRAAFQVSELCGEAAS